MLQLGENIIVVGMCCEGACSPLVWPTLYYVTEGPGGPAGHDHTHIEAPPDNGTSGIYKKGPTWAQQPPLC
jgi:hypothetical protein